MISLILPYWNRQKAADRALASIAEVYMGCPIEVIVVDDGSSEPFVPPEDFPLPIKVAQLPGKTEAKSPVVPWNVGALVSLKKYIALSCIEVVHTEPVLMELMEAAASAGPSSIALAAAWCPELDEWHCHTKYRSSGAPALPGGTGRPFCAVMRNDFYLKCGGFNEAYREGAGYEDMDFINRVLEHGAQFVLRDDLVVIHPKSDATINWGAAKFARNKAIYEQRWGPLC